MKSLSYLAVLAILALILAPVVSRAWQVDTNATTSITTIVPEKPSDILIGAKGGTSTVWIAKGQTTNDWVQVSNN